MLFYKNKRLKYIGKSGNSVYKYFTIFAGHPATKQWDSLMSFVTIAPAAITTYSPVYVHLQVSSRLLLPTHDHQ